MDPQFTAVLAADRLCDLLTEAAQQRLAARAGQDAAWRFRLGGRLIRLGEHLTSSARGRTMTAVGHPCTAC